MTAPAEWSSVEYLNCGSFVIKPQMNTSAEQTRGNTGKPESLILDEFEEQLRKANMDGIDKHSTCPMAKLQASTDVKPAEITSETDRADVCKGACRGGRQWGRGGRKRCHVEGNSSARWRVPPAMGAGFPMHPWFNRYMMTQGQLAHGHHSGITGPLWLGHCGCPRPKLHIRLTRKQKQEDQDTMKKATEDVKGDAAAAAAVTGKGASRHPCRHDGRKRGAGSRSEGQRECWYEVVCMPNLDPNGAQVKVEGRKIHITGPRRNDKADGEGGTKEEIHRKVVIPEGVALRTIRSTWLGPKRRRLFIFALRRGGTCQTTEEAKAPVPEAECNDDSTECPRGKKNKHNGKGQRRACWFQVFRLPNVNRDDVNVEIKPKKIIISRPSAHDEVEKSGKAIEVIDLPDDLARPTINTTWLGPHRLCVFALKRPQKTDQNEPHGEVPCEKVTEVFNKETGSNLEDKPTEPGEMKSDTEDEADKEMEDLIEEAALVSSMKQAEDDIEKVDDVEHISEDDGDDDWVKPEEEKVAVDSDTITAALQQKCVIGSPSIESSQGGFQMNMDVSGYKAGEISVNVDGHYLEVSGRHEDDKEGEICEYQFKRGFPLSDNVDTEHMRVTVDQESGILHITAPSKLTEADQDTWTIPIEYV